MLFNSFEFLLFLPIVFLLYWFVFGSYAPKWLRWLSNMRMQNLFIVVVSYIFYGWWDWRFLLLIALTTFCSWLSGLLIVSAQKQGRTTTNNYDSRPLHASQENPKSFFGVTLFSTSASSASSSTLTSLCNPS